MTPDITDLSHFELHITAKNSQQNAIDFLAEHTPLSRQKLKKAMSNGATWLESSIGIHRLRRAKKTLNEHDTLHLYYDAGIQNSMPAVAELIADEGDYSIWNKPFGMYSQGSKWGDQCTIYRWAEEHLKPQRPAFLVHRLDRAASGLIILAHSKKAATAFSRLFENRDIQKQYSASVEADLTALTLPLTISAEIDNRSALSRIISVEKITENTTDIIIEIETGRKHQIRKHLSAAGFPIVGDRLYGSGQSSEDLKLRSSYLKFNCPLTGAVKEYSL